MKKLIIFFMIVLIMILYIGCTPKDESKVQEVSKEIKNQQALEERGVFISYIDYGVLNGKNKREMESIITKMIDNISDFGLNSVILQTSPFSDSIYPSKIYKTSHVVVKKEGDELPLDILKFFIDKAKEKNIDVYAWVNPYRIRNENNIEILNKEAYYYKWLDTSNIEISKKGIFLNPASQEVLDYITKGLEELCNNYDIKGVIYDDYYYPSETIDLKDYEKTDKRISLKEYRINNINKLIEQSYNTIKKVNKNIKFGLSPAGNIENNLDKEYLDIKNILKSNKIDMIIPQLYYGFNNTSKPYIKTLGEWSNINENNLDLYVALSLYKSGNIDKWAGQGQNEWLENDDIIKKQVLVARNENNYKGFYIFRYDNLFNNISNEKLNAEVDNLKSIIDR